MARAATGIARKLDVNTFTKGMVKDVSKTAQTGDSYFNAENIRLTTDKGQSIGAVENIKGNTLSVTLPNTSAVYRIKPGAAVPAIGTTFYLKIYTTAVPAGFQSLSVTLTQGTHEEMINKFYTLANTDPTLALIGIKAVKTTDNNLIIWSTTDTIINVNGIEVTPGNYYTSSKELSIGSTFSLLGSTTLRGESSEYSILFTVATNLVTPNGQIWKLQYNDVTSANTLTLIYNGKLNFSKDFPIEAIGKYESTKIQRVYWTDGGNIDTYYGTQEPNPVRCINIANDNVMALAPTLLDLGPGVSFNKPTLKEIINGGTLSSGLYQYAYRLKTEGKVTRFSPLSNQIHIVKNDEQDQVKYWYHRPYDETDNPGTWPTTYLTFRNEEYVGTEVSSASIEVEEPVGTETVTIQGGETRKAILLDIKGIDTNYDQIEIVYIYKATRTAAPTAKVISEENIPASGEVIVGHTGNENTIPISTAELSVLGLPFESAKTITTKKERLLVGNIKGNGFLDLKYNARAYRHKSSLDPTDPSGTYVSSTGVDPFSALTSQADIDAINPFNLHDNDPAFVEYKYQSDGQTLGGEGPNISYRFVKKRLEGDKWNKATAPADQPVAAPLVDKNKTTATSSLGVANQSYPHVNTWFDYKSPYVDGLYKSYARGEVYRFGIVFYDLQGDPGYVEWIADIRMPETYDSDSGPNNGGIDQFTLGHTYNSDGTLNGKHALYALGVEFTVNIPISLQSRISGYSIVRVERKEGDKTRLGTGIVQRTVEVAALPTPGFPSPSYAELAMPIRSKWPNTQSPGTTNEDGVVTFDSPDFTFKTGVTSAEPGDTLRIIGLLEGGWTSTPINTYGVKTSYYKHYDMNRPQRYTEGTATAERPLAGNATAIIYDINHCGKVPTKNINTGTPAITGSIFGSTGVADPTKTQMFTNMDWGTTGGLASKGSGYGAPTAIIGLAANINFGNFWGASPASPPASGFVASGMEDWKLLGSYERIVKDQYGGNTESARANSLYISCGNFVPTKGVTTPTTSRVYGGDTYISFYDLTKIRGYSKTGTSLPTEYGNPEEDEFPTLFTTATQETYNTGLIFPTESSVNVDLRKGWHLANSDDGGGIYESRRYLDKKDVGDGGYAEEWKVDDVYQLEDTVLSFIPKPVFVDLEQDHDNRVYASIAKINGEKNDAWRDFSLGTYIDVEGVYGPINKLTTLQDTVYYLQDNAMGLIKVNPKAVVQDLTGTALQLGEGKILDQFVYLSTTYGTTHQWSVINSPRAVYFFDSNSKKILRYTGKGLEAVSDVKGISAFLANTITGELLDNDNPLINKGVTGTYDHRFSEVIFTFKDTVWTDLDDDGVIDPGETSLKNTTIAFNEIADSFTSFYSFTPSIYINDGKRIITPKDSDNKLLYLHNAGNYGTFYGTTYDATIDLITNEHPAHTKVFDNVSWHSEVIDYTTSTNPINKRNETLTSIRFYDDYQNTDYVTLDSTSASPNLKRAEREWQMQVPRDAVKQNLADPDIFLPASLDSSFANKFKKRLRDKYMTINLKFSNSNNRRLILHYLKTFFRISIR